MASYRSAMTIGEITLFDENDSIGNVIADTDVSILELSQAMLLMLEKSSATIKAKLISHIAIELSYRICNLMNTIVELKIVFHFVNKINEKILDLK